VGIATLSALLCVYDAAAGRSAGEYFSADGGETPPLQEVRPSRGLRVRGNPVQCCHRLVRQFDVDRRQVLLQVRDG
jgi:hypothetical protein